MDLFDTCLKVKRLLIEKVGASTPIAGSSGVKLPKLTVPTFDCNIVS